MKKTNKRTKRDLRPEYDFATMPGGVRGKYVKRLREESNIVLLEPEVAAAFPTDEAVNAALRGVLSTTKLCFTTADAIPANRAILPLFDVHKEGQGYLIWQLVISERG